MGAAEKAARESCGEERKLAIMKRGRLACGWNDGLHDDGGIRISKVEMDKGKVERSLASTCTFPASGFHSEPVSTTADRRCDEGRVTGDHVVDFDAVRVVVLRLYQLSSITGEFTATTLEIGRYRRSR